MWHQFEFHRLAERKVQVLIKLTIPEHCQGIRLDKVLASLLTEHSRTAIQVWLDAGRVRLDGTRPSRRMIVSGGESIEIDILEEAPRETVAQDIPIEVAYEDDALIVVNKPAGMVVHPGAGNPHGTLMNALLGYEQSLQFLPRAGIVHRLDKNTSGLIVVAKTESARLNLIRQFKKKSAGRRYVAIVEGRLVSGGTIEVAVGRHRRDRTRMIAGEGKPAVSHYRIVSRYRAHTLIRVSLETGRTHQIRVHFNHVGHPIVGDPKYGNIGKIPVGANMKLIHTLQTFRRQALHAEMLLLDHPLTGEPCHWHLGVPPDMRSLLIALKEDELDHQRTR